MKRNYAICPPRRSITVLSTPRSGSNSKTIFVSTSNHNSNLNSQKQSPNQKQYCQKSTDAQNSKVKEQPNYQLYMSLKRELEETEGEIGKIQVQLNNYKAKNSQLRSQIEVLEFKKENEDRKSTLQRGRVDENIFCKSIEKRLNCLMPKKRLVLQDKINNRANN